MVNHNMFRYKNMGKSTVTLSDDVEDRLRLYIFKKWKGRGRHFSEIIEKALVAFLDQHEHEVKEE